MTQPFHSLYTHGFARLAVCLPSVKVADPQHNAARTLELAQQASDAHAALALFPELGITAYTNDDQFQQDALLEATTAALQRLLTASLSLTPVLLVGAPLRLEDKLFNCAVVIYRGRVLGLAPKSYLPNYREFYEKRQFVAARCALAREVSFLGQTVPFGADLIFEATSLPGLRLHVEICEDLWVPIPPSTWAALSGATLKDTSLKSST